MSAEHFGSGNIPGRADTIRILLVKDVNATTAGGGGGGGGSVQVLQVGVGGWAGPPALPPDPTKTALSIPAGGGGMSQFDVPSQLWV